MENLFVFFAVLGYKGELTAALDFLAENVFTGPLSNERYVTNSKRKME